MKTNRKKLDLDALAVDSFDTSAATKGEGTVHAHGIIAPQPTPPDVAPLPPCTCANTCLCRTAYYHCGTGPFTIYSCDYTHNASCATPVD